MIELNDKEAAELRQRLRLLPAGRPAEETIAVASNASTSVTFTGVQNAALIEVLDQWFTESGIGSMGAGPLELRNALLSDRPH